MHQTQNNKYMIPLTLVLRIGKFTRQKVGGRGRQRIVI